jgi:hypothetical protein
MKNLSAFVCAFVMLMLAQQVRAEPFIGIEYDRGLIGKDYEHEPEIPGWKDQGGGLLEEPIWYHFYIREKSEDAYFVVMKWKLPPKPNSQFARFQVTDTLLIPHVGKNHTVTFDCKPPQTNASIRIFAVVRMDRREWWRDVRQAWKVELHTGKISTFPTKGVACRNEGYGI